MTELILPPHPSRRRHGAQAAPTAATVLPSLYVEDDAAEAAGAPRGKRKVKVSESVRVGPDPAWVPPRWAQAALWGTVVVLAMLVVVRIGVALF